MRDLIIVGGGVSGVICALASNANDILIIERNDKILKKLLATGNGKCNIFNEKYDRKEIYNNPEANRIIISEKPRKFLEDLGLEFTSISERVYPKSEQAKGVVAFLINKLREKNVEIITGQKVLAINGEKVKTLNKTYYGKNILLSIGGNAGIRDTYSSELIHNMDTIKFRPSLVNLITDVKYFNKLTNQRIKCEVTALEEGRVIYCEKGEIIFKKDGLSGIPILQCSALIARNKKVEILMNFIPDMSKKRFQELMRLNEKFDGVLPYGLVENMIRYAEDEDKSLYDVITKFKLDVKGLGDFSDAQVASGGVTFNEVDLHTLKSKKNEDLFFAGEVLNVDGMCGGYNLSWAIASGIRAAKNIDKRLNEQ